MSKFSTVVVDHFTNPRSLGRLERPDAQAFVGNPVCGDQILLSAIFKDGQVEEIKFEARGCAAALATGSFLTDMLVGKNLEECEKITVNEIVESLGGLSPEQSHVAELGHDVIQRLILSKQTGLMDQPPKNGD